MNYIFWSPLPPQSVLAPKGNTFFFFNQRLRGMEPLVLCEGCPLGLECSLSLVNVYSSLTTTPSSLPLITSSPVRPQILELIHAVFVRGLLRGPPHGGIWDTKGE